jgi:DNA polymerase bacteriophage-type
VRALPRVRNRRCAVPDHQLPSGSQLFYPHARFVAGKARHVLVAKDNAAGRWLDTNLYGGKFVENIVQSVARDLLAEAMLRIEGAGYSIVTHSHDEIVAEVEQNFGSADELARFMTVPPAWVPEMPLAAKAAVATNYTK